MQQRKVGAIKSFVLLQTNEEVLKNVTSTTEEDKQSKKYPWS
jgi:hypothetical protein